MRPRPGTAGAAGRWGSVFALLLFGVATAHAAESAPAREPAAVTSGGTALPTPGPGTATPAAAGSPTPAAGPGPSANPAGAAQGVLRVTIRGLRRARGTLLLSLFGDPDGYPDHPERAFASLRLPVRGTTVQGDFAPLPPGRYALSVLHDENGNERLDTSWIGIPREGIGASREAHQRRSGSPRFDEAVFSLPAGTLPIQVTLRYY